MVRKEILEPVPGAGPIRLLQKAGMTRQSASQTRISTVHHYTSTIDKKES